MADSDDLTGFLPDPPPPDGDRRSKAIAAALRRFDEAHEQADGDDRPTSPETPAAPGRAKYAVLASAALVALVTVPLLMTLRFGPDATLERRQPSARERSVALDLAEQEPSPAEAPRDELPAPSVARNGPAAAAAPPPSVQAMIAPPAVVPSAENRKDVAAPQVASAAPEMAQPSAPLPFSARASLREESADSAGALVVTGSRVPRPEADKPARDRRLVPSPRQIRAWQACTVADERRTLRTCAAKDRAAPGAAELTRGLRHSLQGDDRGALKAFDTALAAAPGSTAVLLNRALVRQRLGDLDGASADLDRAIRSSPADARTYYFRSLLRRKTGNEAGADDDLARAIDLQGSLPNSSE